MAPVNSNWASAIPWTPREYQVMSVKFLLERAGAALFLDPGLGKTSTVLAASKILRNKGMIGRVLVVAPRRVMYGVWPAEIAKWLDFCDTTYTILHGPHKEDRLDEETDIHIINYEGLKWLIETGVLSTGHYDVLVADELSRLKHTNTQRFKALKPHLRHFKRRWGLTGTPIANGLINLFGQMYVVDLGYSLGPYITHYRNKYFNQTGYGGYTWELKPGAEEEIFERCAPNTLRLKARDWLELPEQINTLIPVQLPPKARKIYHDMEKHFIAEVGNSTVMSPNAAAAQGRCQQIANGCLYLDPNDKSQVETIHTAKVEALVELVEELQGKPLMVLYSFIHDINAIKKAFKGVDIPVIGGDTSDKQAEKIIEQWNQGLIPLVLGHPSSISVGLNLQDGGCAHVCFYGQTFDLEKYQQSIERVLRQGNTADQVIVYHIVAENTVDYDILHALEGKDSVQTRMLDLLRQRAEEV